MQSSSDDWYRDNHGDGFLPSRPLMSVKPDEHQPLRAYPSPTPGRDWPQKEPAPPQLALMPDGKTHRYGHDNFV